MIVPPPALLADLAALLGPAGYSEDPAVVTPWLTDWRGRYHGRTAALLSPANTEQVAAVVRLVVAHRVPLVAQGGNSGTVGGATPPADGSALLLSLRRMARPPRIDPSDVTATVDAGVILADLHDAAAAQGLRFPLSLAARGSATIGGLVSTNAGGIQVLRFGTMRGLVLGLEAVLPDGSVFRGLSSLRKDNRGYDLRQLLTGAEGTLGIVTAATLRLVPAIGTRAVAWAAVPDPHAALRLLRRLDAALGTAVESFEIMPASGLALVLRHIPDTRAPVATKAPWHVLIEATAPTGAADPADALGAALQSALADGLIVDAAIAQNETQADALWKLRETLPEAERIDGLAVKHDIAVPVSAMPGFILAATDAIEAAHAGARVLAFGHLGDGNVHFNVRAPAGTDAAAWSAANGAVVSRDVHDRVMACGGTISAEHGIGQAKLAEFARTADPVRLATMRAIKTALDPLNLFNPGKLVPLAPPSTAP
ncbi:FAD-binding oxidoreductase [Sphingomonas montana]|uniref:FAD-binding oxidoreductase n=1 Tax=Sphingomonas montana TaxID=1843236 RepID=UPI00096D396F|nr:FAD-binding oxidoreductase [Sphingomonas montana]